MSASPHLRLRRGVPVLVLAAVAFAVGVIAAAGGKRSPAQALAASYAAAWSRGEYAAMYADLDAAARRALTPEAFAHACAEALAAATAEGERVAGPPHDLPDGRVGVPMRVATRLFGVLRLEFGIPVHEGREGARLAWEPSVVFPGLRPGEHLSSHTELPPRAPLLARDGSVLAEGPPGAAVATQTAEATRASPLGEAAGAVVGTIGPVPPSRRQALSSEGVPADALVGLSGLELSLDQRLRGSPGGELLAGTRVLALAAARPSPPVRTTISPAVQRAAVAALGGQYGGVVALAPATGQILAVAGIGLDGLQPPGSTFKMVTVTGVLQAGIATPGRVFPYATYATLDGVKLHNANGEECGGTLELAFAVSCNSVFSPLGVKLGAARLVAAAQAYGFNAETGIAGAPASTLPQAAQIQGELALGSTAIGQGQVLATPLQMALVAATVGEGGRRPRPRLTAGGGAAFAGRASSAAVAHTVRRLMIAVVRSGTGTAAAIPGVTVAGKTGTAELKAQCTSSRAPGEAQSSEGGEKHEACANGETETSNTDAWFAAFAPAIHPRVAVCVMLVKDGAGGATAAPVARQVLEAALQAGP